MKLSELLSNIKTVETVGSMDVDITGINIDSRRIEPGNLFVAMRGTQVDGHQFIPKAVELGAAAVLCEEIPASAPAAVTFGKVRDCEDCVGHAATAYYGNPTSKL